MFGGILSSIGNVVKSVAAPLISGGLSFLGQQSANQQNKELAQAQIDFQREMSNTSYQRAVADMMAAGLNPMLAYSQGGASTPTGQSAVMQNALGAGATSGQQAYQLALNTAMNEADVLLKREQAGAAGAQEDLNRANMNLALVEAANKSAQLPGHQKFSQQVASIINQNNAVAASNTAQAAQRTAELPESKAIGRLYEGDKGVYIKGLEKIGQGAAGLGIGASSATSAFSNMFRPNQGLDPRPRSGRR
jgi:hypothetical protein